jgi:hypothetical protein
VALEKEHEKAGNVYAKKRGWRVYKIQFVGRRGATDRMYSHPLCGAYFVEWKRPGEVPTEQQERRHAEMRAAGLRVVWVDCIEKFVVWCDKVTQTRG